MFENIAAIDVGTNTVKLVTVKTGFHDFQLKSFNYEPVDPDQEDRTAAVVATIQRILSEEDLGGYRIITNLPMEMELIRTISFPFSDVEKIADAIPYEAEENIPFKLEELQLDFQSLRSFKEGEGRILLAAVHKNNLNNFLQVLNTNGVKPITMGMEANALYECYRYFNKIDNETVIQLDIGHGKTIVNFISANNLLYTRSIAIGIGTIIKAVALQLKIPQSEATRLFLNLNLDLTSFENNERRDYYKSLGLNRQQLKKIYAAAQNVSDELVEQIILTMKAMKLDCGDITFNRALISGGGSNLTGIGTIISRELDIPVDALPFLDDYKEREIRTQFPLAFGTVLAYINRRRSSINFLKGEFIPDIAGESKKIYYLSGGFAILTVLVLIVNFILTAVLTARSNRQYNKIIEEQYNRYFHSRPVSGDPIAEARKLLKKEKKEMDGIARLVPGDNTFLDIMKDILTYFPKDGNFILNNLVYNESVIMIEGTAGSSSSIDTFKESLLKTKKFDSVNLNIKYSRQNEVKFSMTIKYKTSADASKEKGGQE
ncbi:MAG: pilus assembly protein PilM [Spirochaetes bacterium]|nr:pilus assembly protein PilM [Spirochaetota bacterium]